ncbi:UxaA family hydrolase, partial [Escherichia coli]|uniref:UxaA family hydrolase n=1 Tax=Escherichia coli TaxID=562 RepID=UPI003D3618EA
MQKILRIDSNDNLIVALKDLHAGESFSWDDDNITLVTDVKAKHKFATQDIPLDGIVSMYGTPVGKATRPIVKGEAITVDNIRWICPYISRHLLSLNPLLACCRRYSR